MLYYMKLTSETWEALAKLFLTMANGLILAGIVAYVFEEKNLFAGIIVVWG